jgi:hypothetical protein
VTPTPTPTPTPDTDGVHALFNNNTDQTVEFYVNYLSTTAGECPISQVDPPTHGTSCVGLVFTLGPYETSGDACSFDLDPEGYYCQVGEFVANGTPTTEWVVEVPLIGEPWLSGGSQCVEFSGMQVCTPVDPAAEIILSDEGNGKYIVTYTY